MKEFSIPMALFDLLPVFCFLTGALIITAGMRRKMTLPCRILFEGGSGLVFAAGLLKALYKLICALGLGDIAWMSRQFFFNQALGFLLAGLGLTLTVTRQGRARKGADAEKVCSILPIPVMGLVGIMVAGLAALDASLCFLAAGKRKRSALVLFIFSFFMCLGMGYLSSRSFEKASMNWIAEGVNAAGQMAFLAGCLILHKASPEQAADEKHKSYGGKEKI